MVRRGWFALVTAGALAVAAPGCSDGGDDDRAEDGPPTTAAAVPATLPDDVDAGTGQLVLDGDSYALTVRACELTPVTDPATGVTTVLSVDLDDTLGVAVSITRSSVEGAVPTVTDTVSVVDPDGALVESSRADAGGRYIDLLVDGALRPLLSVDDGVIAADGVFGPPGARPGDPAAVEGSLLVRCPPGG